MIKKKKCSVELCNAYVWREGKCWYHCEKKQKDDDDQKQKDFEFYQQVWDTKPHRCISCDKALYRWNKLTMEHGLPKNKYPQYRHSMENVNIICPTCHALKERGFALTKYQEVLDELMRKHLDGELE